MEDTSFAETVYSVRSILMEILFYIQAMVTFIFKQCYSSVVFIVYYFFNNHFYGSLIAEGNNNSVHEFVIFVIIKGELAAGG